MQMTDAAPPVSGASYTLEDAARRLREEGSGGDIIKWSDDFKRMLVRLKAPSEVMEAFKGWDGMPVPNDAGLRAWQKMVNHGVPSFWAAVVNTYGGRHMAPELSGEAAVTHRLWKSFWAAEDDEIDPSSLHALMRRVTKVQLTAVKGDRPDAIEVATRMGKGARLTQICETLMALDEFSVYGPVIDTMVNYRAPAVSTSLEAANIEYIRDIFDLTSPEEMVGQITWMLSNAVVCSECRMVMPLEFTHRTRMGQGTYLNESDFSNKDTFNLPVTYAACRLCIGLYGDIGPAIGGYVDTKERTIMESIGTHPETSPEVVTSLAYLNGLTRARMNALLYRKAYEAPGELELCPKAGKCQTFCGELQQEGKLAHPATFDGRWQSCGYGGFDRQVQAHAGAATPGSTATSAETVEEPEAQDSVSKAQMAFF